MRISNALWRGALLALVLSPAGASLAKSTTKTAAEPTQANSTDAEEPSARPFIERSLVIAPEQVGKFRLYSMNGFDNPGAGIGVRYQHDDFPTVRIDIFVYPAGRQVREEVLVAGMREIQMALEDAAKQGKYTDVTVGDPVPFDLRRVEQDGSLSAAQPSAPQAGDDAAATPLADAVATAGFQNGLRMPARLTIQDEPQNSLAFLFYRGLYLVKGRISASPTLLPDESFDRFGNHAMASLVPLLATRSTGGCRSFEVTFDRDEIAPGTSVATLLAATRAAGAEEACEETLDESIPAGHRAMPLVYTPEMWSGKQ